MIASAVLFSSTLVGCSSSSSNTNADTSKKALTVSVWSWRSQDKPLWAKVEEKLKAKGENITIDFRSITPTQYDATLQTAMNGGQGPDIITSRAGSMISSYGKAGQFADLKGKVDTSGFDKGTMDQAGYNGDPYAVPFAVQTSQIFYNKDIFQKYNLQEPKTWDEFVNVANTLKKNGVTPIGVSGREGWALNLIVDSIGASVLRNQGASDLVSGKTKFNSPPFLDVLNKVNSLKPYLQKDFSASSYQDMETLFTQGKVAMIWDGIWAVQTLVKQNPDLKIGAFMTPPVDSSKPPKIYAFLDGGYAANAKSPNLDAAMKVLSFTASKEFGQMYTDEFGEISAFPGVTAGNDKPLLQWALKAYQGNIVKPLFRIRSSFDNGTPSLSTDLAAGMQAMLQAKLTPTQLGDKLTKDISAWYQPFKK